MKVLSWIPAVLFCCGFAAAGFVDYDLEVRLETMAPGHKAECVIYLAEQFDVASFKQMMTMANSTRGQRHSYVINNLQEIAAATQADLLTYLEQGKSTNEVGDYKSYWVANFVYAELSSRAVYDIANRPEVEIVHLYQKPELIKPTGYGEDDPVIAGVAQGLVAINAPAMWALGYSGAGRLVANIDTGVDGNHPALNARWRGNNGAAAVESWLDTANPGNSFPYDTDSHGTHTMGTITGLGAATGDTVGVAFGAQWIAARAIVTNGNEYAAFQWIADPDGDPNTIDDVPDVVSNSWGYHNFTCPTYVWSLIDNCEAAGIVVVFAAGNRQSGDPYTESVWAPASRNTSPYNTFSVGAVNGNTGGYPIADFSARGPSQCDHVTIKPEVVAPGVNVRSSVPGGGYQQYGWSGTSMACPHVAGAVALLRQYNPNATVDTIKWALMQSAMDLGSPGEDNTYGYGLIDVRQALNLMPSNEVPFVYVDGFIVIEPIDNFPDPGDNITLIVTLTNSGTDVDDVYALLSSGSQHATITQDSAYFGQIEQGRSVNNNNQPFAISIGGDTPPGYQMAFDLEIHGSGYSTTGFIEILIGRLGQPEAADHNIGSVDFTVSNFGIYGLNPPDFYPGWNGQGFRTPRGSTNYLFEGALLIGDGPTRVSNGARDENEIIESDFLPITGISVAEPGIIADQESNSLFNDQDSNNPLNVTVEQTSYAWAETPNDLYIITLYIITNAGQDTLTDLRVAHYEDWDMPWESPYERVNYNSDRNLGYQYYSNIYRGMAVLNDEGAVSFKALRNNGEVYPPRFTLADKWSYMNIGFYDTIITTSQDCSMMLTTGPFNLNPGHCDTAAFAILGAGSLFGLQSIADAAISMYEMMIHTGIVDKGEETLPQASGITGNYPNPFNPSTVIKFSIEMQSQIRLDIYDILGRKIKTLVDSEVAPGFHEVVWDGRDANGNDVASGIYFARLTSGSFSDSRKMLLLK